MTEGMLTINCHPSRPFHILLEKQRQAERQQNDMIYGTLNTVSHQRVSTLTKRDKRLQKLRQNPKNVSFDDLQIVLEDFGFELMRSSGSHHSFSIEINGESRLFVVPFRRPVKPVYVREALRLIDLILSEKNEDKDNANDD